MPRSSLLLHDLLEALQIRGARIEINSLGDATCRPAYRAVAARLRRGAPRRLCENCARRLERNPLRLLDCKVPECRQATAGAPLMLDHLCGPCQAHFDGRTRRARARGRRRSSSIARMVRGLDYYVRTAFEVVAEGLGAQNAVGGGGRYDGLVTGLGGPDAPGIGFALGVERLVLAMATTRRRGRWRPRCSLRRSAPLPKPRPCTWRTAGAAPASVSR